MPMMRYFQGEKDCLPTIITILLDDAISLLHYNVSLPYRIIHWFPRSRSSQRSKELQKLSEIFPIIS